ASAVASLALFGVVVAFAMGFIPHSSGKPSDGSIQEQWTKLDKDGQEAFDHGEFITAQQYFDSALQSVQKAELYPQLVAASYLELADLARARKKFDEARILDTRAAQVRQDELAHVGEIQKRLEEALQGKVTSKADLEEIANSANDQI